MGRAGIFLAELIVGALILGVAIMALLGAFAGQATVNEHTRNLFWAANDARRVMEGLRRLNTGAACTQPPTASPVGFADWDAWLADTTVNGGGGKTLQFDPATEERVIVTTTPGADPMPVTVAVCWRHRRRILGECAGTPLVPNDANGDGIISSPAMLSTFMTCRKG